MPRSSMRCPAVNSSIVHDKDITAGTVGKTPNGTGPFAWGQWDQGQQVTLKANPCYFGGAPEGRDASSSGSSRPSRRSCRA